MSSDDFVFFVRPRKDGWEWCAQHSCHPEWPYRTEWADAHGRTLTEWGARRQGRRAVRRLRRLADGGPWPKKFAAVPSGEAGTAQ